FRHAAARATHEMPGRRAQTAGWLIELVHFAAGDAIGATGGAADVAVRGGETGAAQAAVAQHLHHLATRATHEGLARNATTGWAAAAIGVDRRPQIRQRAPIAQ